MTDSETFEQMAKKIVANESYGFGGAAVIVFPQGNVAIESINLLITDPKGDVAQFLATLKTRLEMVQQELGANQQAFGRR